MSNHITLGTRGSELALRQTQLVEQALQKQDAFLSCSRSIIKTAGDLRQDIPLCEVNRATQTQDKGVFIAALEDALAAGEVDAAVHSLKDMPGTLDDRFEIAAVLPREEICDVLIIKAGADMQRLVIGTSSTRRVEMAKCYWGGTARCVPIRGNVNTRLKKLAESKELSAIILARAGLNRLGLTQPVINMEGQSLICVNLSINSFMPALGQGAVAVEIRRGDEKAKKLLSTINDRRTEYCVRCERSFLDHLKADCSVPVGGYAELIGSTMFFRAIYFTKSGVPVRISQRGSAADPEGLGMVAYEQLMERLTD